MTAVEQVSAVEAETGAPEPGSCPSWCVLEAGHPYSGGTDECGAGWWRIHRSAPEDHDVAVERMETVGVDGTVALRVAIVEVAGSDWAEVTTGDMIQLMQEVVAAALVVKAIEEAETK